MRTVFAIIKKEFLQVFRDKLLTMIVFLAPIIQLIVLVYAANFEVKNISVGFIDKDNSSMSLEIKNTLISSGYFLLKPISKDYETALEEFEFDRLDAIIEIPNNFEPDVLNGNSPRLMVSINAINSMKAGVAASYIGQAIQSMAKKQIDKLGVTSLLPNIEVTYSDWYNPLFNYKAFMLPGIMCVLITVIGIMLTALNLVKEKESGTIEQLNVTPISKIEFIAGKLIPFGIIGIIQLAAGLLVSIFLFGLEIQGAYWLIFLLGAVYLFSVLGIGFLISTISENQTQAMFVALFCMFIFTLLSGLFTPIESMPKWAQIVTGLNPTTYLIESIRLIILKGSGFSDVKHNLYALSMFAVVINTIVILRYRKTN